jgi:hypothetical protein
LEDSLPPEIYRVYQEGDDMHYSILKVHHISIFFSGTTTSLVLGL